MPSFSGPSSSYRPGSKTLFLLLCYLACVGVPASAQTAASWQNTLHREIPLLGHRNWIVIVDSAYPLQVSPGIETIETGATHQEVLHQVLDELARAKHVTPFFYMDAELPFVPEKAAPGVTAYRSSMSRALGSLTVHSLPHLQLIQQLNDAGSTFHVLVLKTTLTLPYTSVFLRLDCKYWDDASEQLLQNAMKEQSQRLLKH